MKMKKITIIAITGVLLALGALFGTGASVYAQDLPTPSASGNALRANLQTRAREAAGKIFDRQFLERLNALRVRISSNTKLSTEQKQVLLAKVDSEITWFTNKKGELATATTVAQIRAIVRDARNRFLQVARDLRHLYIARGYVVSLERVITNIEKNIIPKIEAKLTELVANGVDVKAELGYLLNAKTALASAKSEINEVKDSTTFDSAKKHFDLAKGYVKTARQELKKALEGIKLKN